MVLCQTGGTIDNFTAKNYRDLIVWQRGIKLTKEIYRITGKFPEREMFGLSNQLRRASVSIPSNIAEGQGRQHRKEFIQFLFIALGSLGEVDTQLVLAAELDYITIEETTPVVKEIGEIRKMLYGLIHSLN
jgi:four helix bundle protein